MPRRPRVFVSGAVYHVYCRVARGEPVFSGAREAAAQPSTAAGAGSAARVVPPAPPPHGQIPPSRPNRIKHVRATERWL
jgi:hypothetical protein